MTGHNSFRQISGHVTVRPPDRRPPAIQPSKDYYEEPAFDSQPDDLLKDKRKLKLERKEPLTVVISTKCKDGIVMIADVQYTDADYHVSHDSKLFHLWDNQDGQYILGLAGPANLFFRVRNELQSRIHEFVNSHSEPMTRSNLETILAEYIDALYRYYYLDRPERSGRRELGLRQFSSHMFEAILAARATKEDGGKELLLYTFSLESDPEENEFHSIGSGMHNAFAIRNAIEYVLKKVHMRWKDLTMKLVSQVMFLGMRYISSSNITVSNTSQSLVLTETGPVKDNLNKDIFPAHYEDNEVTYKQELLATALEVLGDKAKVLKDMLNFKI